jgi:hypothetical protein
LHRCEKELFLNILLPFLSPIAPFVRQAAKQRKSKKTEKKDYTNIYFLTEMQAFFIFVQ